MTAKTNAERQRAYKANKAAEGLTEVRGIFAPPARHAEVREAAAKALKPKRAKQSSPPSFPQP